MADEGYRVLSAANGQEALNQVRQAPPDLILLDMLMPVMDGATFARTYHQQAGSHAPIVVMAATEPERRAADIGAAAYLSKPFDVADVLHLVQQLASRPT